MTIKLLIEGIATMSAWILNFKFSLREIILIGRRSLILLIILAILNVCDTSRLEIIEAITMKKSRIWKEFRKYEFLPFKSRPLASTFISTSIRNTAVVNKSNLFTAMRRNPLGSCSGFSNARDRPDKIIIIKMKFSNAFDSPSYFINPRNLLSCENMHRDMSLISSSSLKHFLLFFLFWCIFSY